MKKKLVALLMMSAMVVSSLSACGQKEGQVDKPSESESEESMVDSTNEEESTEEVNVKPYEGQTISIWADSSLTNVLNNENITTSNYNYIFFGAMVEWCEENGVTLEYEGVYDQTTIMASIAAGETTDLAFSTNLVPIAPSIGLAEPLSEECVEELNEIFGTPAFTEGYAWKGNVYGMLHPLQGTNAMVYNPAIFEEYSLKTPKELFLEGNWNVDTWVECMKAVTKDLDGDGTFDTYGMRASALKSMQISNFLEEGSDGSLTSLLNTDSFMDFATIAYNGITEGYIQDSSGTIFDNLENPRRVFQPVAGAHYMADEVWWTLSDGTILETVPDPIYADSTYNGQHGQVGILKLSSCDADEAVEAMLCHVAKVCEKFKSLASLGALESDYEYLKGSTPGTAAVVAVFEDKYEKLENWSTTNPYYDVEYQAKLNEYINSGGYSFTRTYSDVKYSYKKLIEQPPATSVAELIETVGALIDKYNATFAR